MVDYLDVSAVEDGVGEVANPVAYYEKSLSARAYDGVDYFVAMSEDEEVGVVALSDLASGVEDLCLVVEVEGHAGTFLLVLIVPCAAGAAPCRGEEAGEVGVNPAVERLEEAVVEAPHHGVV